MAGEGHLYRTASLIKLPQMCTFLVRCCVLLQAQKLGATVLVKLAEKPTAGPSRSVTPVTSSDCLPITKPRGEGSCAPQSVCSMPHLPVSAGLAQSPLSFQASPDAAYAETCLGESLIDDCKLECQC